jgi:hypothetical protein
MKLIVFCDKYFLQMKFQSALIVMLLIKSGEQNSVQHSEIEFNTDCTRGCAVMQLVEALCYRLEGHGFDSR